MTKEATEIEVEVLEIDGVAPVVKEPASDLDSQTGTEWQDWRKWQGRVRSLDAKWWPLWAFLGIILLFLLVTVGLVLGVVYLIFRVFVNLIRAIMR